MPRKRFFLFPLFLLLSLSLGYLLLDQVLHRVVRSSGSLPMPTLSGLTLEEANVLCTEQGLVVELKAREYDARLPEGFVLRQSPAPGRQVKAGRRVKLTLSSGPEMILVPELRSESERQAVLSLEDRGLRPGDRLRVAGQFPAGQVLALRPPSGRRIPRGSSVDLLLSSGEEPPAYLLPDFQGKSLLAVREILSAASLPKPKVRFRSLPGRKSGKVLEQNPPAGSRIEKGDKLELVVSSGS